MTCQNCKKLKKILRKEFDKSGCKAINQWEPHRKGKRCGALKIYGRGYCKIHYKVNVAPFWQMIDDIKEYFLKR